MSTIARLYSSVFSLLHKPANVRVESRIVNGSEFQSEGPIMCYGPLNGIVTAIDSMTQCHWK